MVGGEAGGGSPLDALSVLGSGHSDEQPVGGIKTSDEPQARPQQMVEGKSVGEGSQVLLPEGPHLELLAEGAGKACFVGTDACTRIIIMGTPSNVVLSQIVVEDRIESATFLSGGALAVVTREGRVKTVPLGCSVLCDPSPSEVASLPPQPWRRPSPDSLGTQIVSFRTTGMGGNHLVAGSRVRVQVGDRDLDGTVIMYSDMDDTYTLRLDEGEVEKDVPGARITRVLMDAYPQARCWYEGCRVPVCLMGDSTDQTVSRSVTITMKTRAGNQDWKPLWGRTYCFACYVRYSSYATFERSRAVSDRKQFKRKIKTERPENAADAGEDEGDNEWGIKVEGPPKKKKHKHRKPRPSRVGMGVSEGKGSGGIGGWGVKGVGSRGGPSGEKNKCEGDPFSCDQCGEISRIKRRVSVGTKAGGRDWAAYAGQSLCNACYVRYAAYGHFEYKTLKGLERYGPGGTALTGNPAFKAQTESTSAEPPVKTQGDEPARKDGDAVGAVDTVEGGGAGGAGAGGAGA